MGNALENAAKVESIFTHCENALVCAALPAILLKSASPDMLNNGLRSTKGRDAVCLTLIVLYAVMVRLPGLGTLPIWYDEALSYWSATRNWHDLWTIVPHYETHPVLFYSLLKLWSVFGSSELVLRALSVSLDLLAVLFVYRSGKMLGGTACAVLAAILFASAPFQILQSQNIRPYTLFTLASAVTVYSALRIIRYQTGPAPHAVVRDSMAYLGLSLGAALLLWSHNLGVLQAGIAFTVPGYFWLTGRLSRTALGCVILAGVGAVLLYLPNLLTLATQFNVVSRGWWLTAPSFSELAGGTTEIFGFPILGGGDPAIIALNMAFIMPAIMLIGRLVRNGDEGNPALRRCMALLACLAFGPWLVAIIVTYGFLPIFLPRTLIMCQVPAILLLSTLAIALKTGMGQGRPWAYAAFLTIPLLTMALFHLTDRRAQDPERRSKAIADDLARSGAAAAGPVFIVPNAAALAVNYYLERQNSRFHVVPLPAPYPAAGFAHYPDGSRGTPGLDEGIEAIMARQLGMAKRAWLVSRRADLYDAGAVAERTLDRHFACKAYRVGSDDRVNLREIAYYGLIPSDCRLGELAKTP